MGLNDLNAFGRTAGDFGNGIKNDFTTAKIFTAAAISTVFAEVSGKASPDVPAAKTGEPPQLAAGKEAHKNEEVRPGEKAEVPTPSGREWIAMTRKKLIFERSSQTTPVGSKLGNANWKGTNQR